MSDDGSQGGAGHDFPPAVIIDNGSGALKVGMAGDSRPQAIIPNIVGRPNAAKRMLLKRGKDTADDSPTVLFGDDVLDRAGQINITYPMEDGIVKEWGDMQSLWEHAYEEIEEESEDQPVLITEAPFNPRKNREKMVEIFFEAMNVPALQIKMQALCSLYAAGRTTGLVVDSGDGVTHTVPVSHGAVITKGILRSNIAGREVTKVLQRMLFQKGYNFSTAREMQFVQEIKEDACYVAQDFRDEVDRCEAALRSNDDEFDVCSFFSLLRASSLSLHPTPPPTPLPFQQKAHTLPDGQNIVLSDERFKASEILFNPARMDSEEKGLHKMVWSSVQSCEVDSRRDLMANVILSGGNTLFPGLAKRLQEEVTELKGPSSAIVKVVADPGRAEMVFSGASVRLFPFLCVVLLFVFPQTHNDTHTHTLTGACFSALFQRRVAYCGDVRRGRRQLR